MSEIWQLSATEMAQRIADRQLSSEEVVYAHLARIDAVNPALNAVVRVLADEARAAAVVADRKLAAGERIGLEGPRGSVAEAGWDAFLRDVVVPRFPSGLTVTYAKGHWQAPGGPPQREASRVLEIVYDERAHHDRRIEEIAATYKATFQQQSVMVIRMPANVCF